MRAMTEKEQPEKIHTQAKGEIMRRGLILEKLYPGNKTNHGDSKGRNEGYDNTPMRSQEGKGLPKEVHTQKNKKGRVFV